jgi:FtsH-binding integral membrane protein
MENVFERTQSDASEATVSDRVYNLIIGGVLLYGFAVNWLMVKFVPADLAFRFGFWPFIIGYFVLCFAGIAIFTKSKNPVLSFIGYNLVVVPFGFVVNIAVSAYDPAIVLQALKITGLTTGVMMLAGSLYPDFFRRIAGALFVALISVIIVQFVFIIFFHDSPAFIDWIVVFIFCGYIGYDWSRAQHIPKTADNAVDSAAALYMDIINLFLRILRILGRK